ncbi:MAG: hypothetical protein PSY12_09820 [bacterium]|nr:hypothetical protein [bacterium]
MAPVIVMVARLRSQATGMQMDARQGKAGAARQTAYIGITAIFAINE